MSERIISETMMVVGDSDFKVNNNKFDDKNSSDEDYGGASSPLAPLTNNDCEAQEGSESEEGSKKKRRRRVKGGKHHRKKWKPYNKLSYSERRELDERETARANQKREEAFAHGHPVAPYNTTQFLMEDHGESISPDLKAERMDLPSVLLRESSESSEELVYSSGEEEEHNFMEKEFSETYNNMHAERLQMMSKDELIKDFLEMEAKLERLQNRYDNKMKRKSSKENADSSGSLSSGGEEFIDFDAAKKCEEENKLLKEENDRLKMELKKLTNCNTIDEL